MKMVFVVYNAALHEEILEILDEVGVEGYTRWSDVTGVGRASGPHLNTHVWPARNAALAVAAEDEQADRLLAGFRALRARAAREGVKAFCWHVEDSS